MEAEKQKIYTIVAVVAVFTVVLSCAIGALAGGTAGFIVGKRQASRAAAQALERGLEELQPSLPQVPLPRQEDQPLPQPGPQDWPFELPLGREGALVVEVFAETPADEAGLRVGDLITAVDRTPVDRNHDLRETITQYEPGDRVTIHIWRTDRKESIRVRLGERPDEAGAPYLGILYNMRVEPDFELPGG
jgi:S1-C subfamily serine protease